MKVGNLYDVCVHNFHRNLRVKDSCKSVYICRGYDQVAYPRFKKGGQDADGAQGWVWGGRGGVILPSPPGLGKGLCPFHRFCFNFGAQHGLFWCILRANFIAVELPVLREWRPAVGLQVV